MLEGPNFPPYPIPEGIDLKSGGLPVRVDNSIKKYFPEVFNQYGWSCNQASSIGYLLTYELARARDVSAFEPENQYPPLYAWNFLNDASTTHGVSYFDSWEIIKANGCPNVIDYPYQDDGTAWMSGYDKYYRAMHNKVGHNYSLGVNTPEGLEKLKRYLYDHFNGSKNGGVANFQIGSGGIRFASLPPESYNAGSPIITGFGAVVGHAMTIVGYDDSVKLDFNGDGKFTNDIDINGDFVVDMADWEKGALIVVNSWGKGWADSGKSYVAYRVLTRYGFEGGFWNRSVHLIDLVNNYEPQLTMRAKLIHPVRNSIKIMAGVSGDPMADRPEQILEFPLFKYQGGSNPFGGAGSDPMEPFELGLDISPLLSFVEPGEEARFFLALIESGGYSGNSRIREFSVFDFTAGEREVLSPESNIPIALLDTTFVSVNLSVDFNKVLVKEYPMEFVRANNWYSKQLQAANLTAPFYWELDYGYEAEIEEKEFPEIEGTRLGSSGTSTVYTELELPFSFPFYGEKYNKIIVNEDGSIFFENIFYEYPYIVDPNLIFKLKKAIIPFGQDLVYYGADNGIYYHESDSVFTIFWAGMGVGGEESYFFRIACNLYPDGKIEFHYGPVDGQDDFWVNYESGLSRGDGRNLILSPLAQKRRYRSNSMLTFDPYPFPDKISLDPGGLLRCRPEKENKTYMIHLRVKDKKNQVAYGVLPLSTADLESASLLSQNFPNPFTDRTRISFVVPEDADARLTVYDLAGRLVSTLVNGPVAKGLHELDWIPVSTGNTQPSTGLYIARLVIGEKDEKIKMLRISGQ
jgi:hypothetical protein